MADRVVVTGGLGFIGSCLCETLLEQGRFVRCVDDLSGGHAPSSGRAAMRRLLARGAEVELAAVRGEHLEGADAVIHLAGLPGVRSRRSSDAIWRANAVLTERLAAAAAARGVRLVLASTSSVYGDALERPTPEHAPPAPRSAYAISKLAAERSLRAAGGDAVIARLFTVYGPGQRPEMAFARWIRALAAGEPLPWCAAPGAARDFTYVDDAVAGLVAALERGRAGEAYNISGWSPAPLTAALELLEAATGLQAVLAPIPPSGSEALHTAGCTRKALAELGYRPRVGLAAGLARQLAAAGRPTSLRRPSAPARALAGRPRSGWGSGGGAPAPLSPRPAGLPAAAPSPG